MYKTNIEKIMNFLKMNAENMTYNFKYENSESVLNIKMYDYELKEKIIKYKLTNDRKKIILKKGLFSLTESYKIVQQNNVFNSEKINKTTEETLIIENEEEGMVNNFNIILKNNIFQIPIFSVVLDNKILTKIEKAEELKTIIEKFNKIFLDATDQKTFIEVREDKNILSIN